MEVQAYKPSDAGNLSTWAADINAAHIEAMRHAESAVEHAKRAGLLLLKVKQKIPHGQFGKWLDENSAVSARQAQRYMQAAQGKPLPVRTIAAPVKNDTVSYLVDEPPKTMNDYFSPNWIPMKGYTYFCATAAGSYWVTHSKDHPGYFHVSHLTDDTYSGTRRPMTGIAVDWMLQAYGLTAPADADWNIRKGFDMSRPFGEPEDLLAEITAQRFCATSPLPH